MNRKNINNLLILSLIICLGTILRFWHLELKPMWIDEVLTALFSLGKNYDLVPVNTLFNFNNLTDIFSLNTPTNCSEIAQNLANQSSHPPLFFCLTNYWLIINHNSAHSLIWQIRSFSALIGILTILATYYLNRIAFSPSIGLFSAAIVAVSPFSVYLSQEARHYTLPLLIITLSLTTLIKIQQELEQGKIIHITWLFWSITNAISLYTHYFCFISFIAQIATILLLIYRLKAKQNLIFIFIYFTIPLILFLPWLSILIKHFTSPTTGWLSQPQHINPIIQTIIAWMLMIIALPIENQKILIQILFGIITISFSIFIFIQIYRHKPPLKNNSFIVILAFISFVLLQFLVIVYGLGKDLTVAPRYNFIYYPAIVSLLAVTLKGKTRLILILVGIISSILVINNLAFQKPYHPEIVAQHFNDSPAPLLVVLGYESSQEMALEISYLLELQRIRNHQLKTMFYFTNRSDNYQLMWHNLSQLSPSILPENIWFFTPHLRLENYPPFFQLSKNNTCVIDRNKSYKLTFPYFYQKYYCPKP